MSGDGAELRRALLAAVRERGGARYESVARALLRAVPESKGRRIMLSGELRKF